MKKYPGVVATRSDEAVVFQNGSFKSSNGAVKVFRC